MSGWITVLDSSVAYQHKSWYWLFKSLWHKKNKTKNEIERESKERRAELQRYEKRVLSKEETLDKKSDALEKKEVKLNAKMLNLISRKKNLTNLKKVICMNLRKYQV